MEETSVNPSIKLLFFVIGGVVQCLYDCKGFLYHLALQYNEQESSCRENSLLQDVYDALDAADEGKAEQGREECMQIVIPFMLEDYRR